MKHAILEDVVVTGSAVACRPEHILLVIPTLNEARHIEECLASLVGSDPFMLRVRAVVADGGSIDGTQNIVRGLRATYPNLRLMHNPDRLQSAAVNIAVARMATRENLFLVRCDAHAKYPPGYVRSVAQGLAAREDAASLVTVMDATGAATPFQAAAAWIVDTPLGCGGSAHRGSTRSQWVDHGHHAGFRLDWFRLVGGYDASFSHNEDAEYDCRLHKAGGRVWLDADIRMHYLMRTSFRGLFRQYWSYGRGRARTLRKHNTTPRLRQMLPPAMVVTVALCLLLMPFLPLAGLIPLAYLTALAASSTVAAIAMRSLSGLWAGPALFAMHTAWGAGFLWQNLFEPKVTVHQISPPARLD